MRASHAWPVESERLEPVTARFAQIPDEHDGWNTFPVCFEFSREPAEYSRAAVHHNPFDVTLRGIEKVRRLVQGSNVGWETRVDPAGCGVATCAARGVPNAAKGRPRAPSPGRCAAPGRSAVRRRHALPWQPSGTGRRPRCRSAQDMPLPASRCRAQPDDLACATRSPGSGRAAGPGRCAEHGRWADPLRLVSDCDSEWLPAEYRRDPR